MYDPEEDYGASFIFSNGINDEFIKPNLDIINKHRIDQFVLSGTKCNYEFTIRTRDGFCIVVHTDLSILSDSEASSFITRGEVPELSFHRDMLIDNEDIVFSVSSRGNSEDKVTSQFTKNQFTALLEDCFTKAIVALEKQNASIMKARTSWYGDSHPIPPEVDGYYHEILVQTD